MKVVARFRCTKKEQPQNDQGAGVTLAAVYSEDESHPNKQYWDATPSGDINMYINNIAAADAFIVGKEYDVAFTEALTD